MRQMAQPFRTAVERRDLDAMAAALHPDVVFHSPAVFKPYEGREATIGLLRHVLEVTVTSIGGGLTGVLAESQSIWIVPRPASERIPAATRVVQISSAVPGAADGGAVTVTRHGQVGSIVALLNRLPIVQPGVTGCPAQIDPKTITMTFSASSSGPALAVLQFNDYQPWRAANSNECAPVQLSVAGRRRPALDGGDFIKRIERIIGLNVT